MKKTIGIIGGMGPMATVDLFREIVQMTKATLDQDHLHIIIDDNAQIPNRNEFAAGTGPDPLPEMVRSALRLENAGADILIMGCNAAHRHYERILPFVKVQFLNMLDETAKEVKRRGYQKVGLLAVDGTIQTGIYDEALKKYGIEAIHPSVESQKFVMHTVCDCVKAGRPDLFEREKFIAVIDEMKGKGAEAMLLGCTEIPVALEAMRIETESINPTLVLAASAILAAGGELKDAI